MREIKFRLWDGQHLQPVGSITFHTDGSYHVNDEFPVNDIEMNERFGGNKYHLMQFTGLHDKNGNDIYEGDIIRCPHRVTHPKEGGVLTQYERTDLIEWDDNEGGFGRNQYEMNEYSFQVIGNIYENPELLGGNPNEIT
jgi:uncharacterized phage protein (TIGR01671 family)